MELVVERARSLHHGDVLGDARQRRSVAGRVVETGRQLGRELDDVRAEHRHESAAEQCVRDVAEPVRDGGRLAAQLELRVLPEDRAVELLQAAAGVDAELVHEHSPGVVVGLERLGLPTRAIERQHQLPPEALAQGVRVDQALEVADELRVGACVELRLDPLLEHGEP